VRNVTKECVNFIFLLRTDPHTLVNFCIFLHNRGRSQDAAKHLTSFMKLASTGPPDLEKEVGLFSVFCDLWRIFLQNSEFEFTLVIITCLITSHQAVVFLIGPSFVVFEWHFIIVAFSIVAKCGHNQLCVYLAPLIIIGLEQEDP